MNFRRLKYFVKIVDIGSLTQAAEVLHIAQPALSQQVATLEGELNQQLLIRTKRGVTPTDAGKILYTHARAILRQCEQAQLAVHNVGQSLSGQVSIGFAPGTAASSITMPLLQAVRAEFPEVVIYLHENSGAVLNEKLINHQLDMAVIYEHSPVAGVSSQALLKEDLFLVGTQDCPGQSVDVNAIAQMNLFFPVITVLLDFVLMRLFPYGDSRQKSLVKLSLLPRLPQRLPAAWALQYYPNRPRVRYVAQ